MGGEHKHPDKGENGVMSGEAGLAGQLLQTGWMHTMV